MGLGYILLSVFFFTLAARAFEGIQARKQARTRDAYNRANLARLARMTRNGY